VKLPAPALNSEITSNQPSPEAASVAGVVSWEPGHIFSSSKALTASIISVATPLQKSDKHKLSILILKIPKERIF
jgi:hypothetical protein